MTTKNKSDEEKNVLYTYYINKVIKEKWGQYFANNHFCTPLCSKKMAV